ncbi:MAG: cellulase family glycosylhydrolase [Myxococcota bacterium]
MALSDGSRAFVERRGAALVVGEDPFRFLGANTYYCMVYAAHEGLRPHVEEIFEQMQRLGMAVLRTWAFNDGAQQWMSLQRAPGVYDEQVLLGLDHVVAMASRHGVRLVLTLVNHWEDYGGRDQYVRWSEGAKHPDDFYSDARCREMYREHCRRIIGRVNAWTGVVYADDPTIMAWELCNEPRCPTGGVGVLTRWVREMAAHVHALAPRQLVCTGLEGFFGAHRAAQNPPRWRLGAGTDTEALHAVDGVDIVSAHVYPDHWGMSEQETLAWMRAQVDAARALGKPLVFGEMGKRGEEDERAQHLERWLGLCAEADAGVSGAMVWSLYHEAYPDYDGFGLYPLRQTHTAEVLKRWARAISDA